MESDLTDRVVANQAEVISEGYPDYDRFTYLITNGLKFNGKTLDEWGESIRFPQIELSMSIEELELFNIRFINVTEIIMNNLGRARAAYDSTRSIYYKNKNKKIALALNPADGSRPKLPRTDLFDAQIKNDIADSYMAYKIAEVSFEFWKVHYDRLKLMDNRLFSMNTIKNIESRIR